MTGRESLSVASRVLRAVFARPLLAGLVLLVASSTTAAALPDPYLVPDATVPWYCGSISERTVRWEPSPPRPPPYEPPPPPPEDERAWKNVSIETDPDGCLEPVRDECDLRGLPCCDPLGSIQPCHPSALVGGAGWQKGVILPGGGGVCITSSGSNLSIETRSCAGFEIH